MKSSGALIVMALLAVVFWLNFVHVLRYEIDKSLRIPFEAVPISGATACPQAYESDWLNILRYTQCKGIDFQGRATIMREPQQ